MYRPRHNRSNEGLNDMDILHLYECSITTRYGLVDKGNPAVYERLAAAGYTAKKNDGYVVTELGFATLSTNRAKFDPPKHKGKKEKEKKYNDYGDREDA